MGIDEFITAREAGKILGVSSSAVHKLCANGTLWGKKVGLQLLFRRSGVTELREDPAYRKRSRSRNAMELGMGLFADDDEKPTNG